MSDEVEMFLDVEELHKVNPEYADWFVHPCVRYIPEGLGGHKWWMVVTPYPEYNAKLENPILYYGVGNGKTPPTEWKMFCVVQDSYEGKGYNADGNLYYDGTKLWIIWKESDTPNTKPECGYKSVMGVSFDGKTLSKPRLLCDNPSDQEMKLGAPYLCLMRDTVFCYGTWCPYKINSTDPEDLKNPRGLSKFYLPGNNLEDSTFVYMGDFAQDYPEGFDYWHTDFFSYKDRYYNVVTPQSGEEIRLGYSDDGDCFHYFKLPLLSWGGNRLYYMYKPSAVVIDDDFYLFFPHKKTRHTVHIYYTHANFPELLKKLEDYEAGH